MSDTKTESVKRDLARILDKVETRSAEGYGLLSFRAKAVGKTKDSIHLAVPTGIISVPLSEIKSIESIPGRSELEVRVDILNGDRITHLRHVPDAVHYPGPIVNPPLPSTWTPHLPPGGFPHVGKEDSTSTNEDAGVDTTCASGGVADQTDDHRPFNRGDTD